MLLFSALLLQQTIGIRVAESRMLPLFTLLLCGASGTALLVQAARGKTEDAPAKGLLLSGKEVVVFALLLACWVLMDRLGFYAAILLFLVPVSLLMEKSVNVKVVLRTLLADVLLSVVLYVAFAVLLKMPTPHGILL